MNRTINIEEIKRDGQRRALHEAIESRLNEVQGRVFEGYKSAMRFTRLGEKVAFARVILDEVEALLKELSNLDANNS